MALDESIQIPQIYLSYEEHGCLFLYGLHIFIGFYASHKTRHIIHPVYIFRSSLELAELFTTCVTN